MEIDFPPCHMVSRDFQQGAQSLKRFACHIGHLIVLLVRLLNCFRICKRAGLATLRSDLQYTRWPHCPFGWWHKSGDSSSPEHISAYDLIYEEVHPLMRCAKEWHFCPKGGDFIEMGHLLVKEIVLSWVWAVRRYPTIQDCGLGLSTIVVTAGYSAYIWVHLLIVICQLWRHECLLAFWLYQSIDGWLFCKITSVLLPQMVWGAFTQG